MHRVVLEFVGDEKIFGAPIIAYGETHPRQRELPQHALYETPTVLEVQQESFHGEVEVSEYHAPYPNKVIQISPKIEFV